MSRRSIGILKDGTSLFGSNLSVNLFSIIISIYIIRTVDKAELALIPIAAILTGVAGALVSLGLPTTVLRMVPEYSRNGEEGKRASLILTDLVVTNTLLTLLLLTFYFCSGFVLDLLLKDHASMIDPLFFIPLIFLGVNYNLSYLRLQSVKEFGTISRTIFISQITQKALIIPMYYYFGAKGILLAITSGYFIGSLLYYARLIRYVRPFRELTSFSGLLRTSMPFYAYGIVRFISTRADQMLISILLPPEKLAVYFIAYKIFTYFLLLCESVFRPIAPRLAEIRSGGMDILNAAYRKVSRWTIIIFVSLSGFTILLARPLMELYAGPKYGDAWPILTVLAIGMIPYAFSFFNITWLMILAPPRKTLTLEMISATCSLSAGLILIRIYGPLGVALGQAITFTVSAVAGSILISSEVKPSIDIRTLRTVVTSLIPMAVVMVWFVWISYNLKVSLLIAVPGFVIFTFLLFARMLEEDRALLQEYLPRRFRFLYRLWPLSLLVPNDIEVGKA